MDTELKQIEDNLLLKQKAYILSLQDDVRVMEMETNNKLNEIEKLNSRIADLMKEINERDAKAGQLNEILKKSNEEVKVLNEKISELNSRCKILEEDNGSKEKHWSEKYNSLLTELDDERKKHRRKITEMEEEKAVVIQERNEIRESYNKQLTTIDELQRSSEDKCKALKIDIDQLNTELEKKSIKEKQQQEHISELTISLKTLENDKSELKNDVLELNKVLTKEKAENSKLIEQYKLLGASLKKKKREIVQTYRDRLMEIEKSRNDIIITAVASYKKEKQILEKEHLEMSKKYKTLEKSYEEYKDNVERTIKSLEAKASDKEQTLHQVSKQMEKTKRDLEVYIEGLEGEKSAYLVDITSLNEAVEKYYRDNKTLIRENRLLVNKLLSLREFEGLKRACKQNQLEGLECNYESVRYVNKKPKSMSPGMKGYERNGHQINKSKIFGKSKSKRLPKNNRKENDTERFFETESEFESRNYDQIKSHHGPKYKSNFRQSKIDKHDRNEYECSDNEATPTILETLKKIQKENKVMKDECEAKNKEVEMLNEIINELKASLTTASNAIASHKEEIGTLNNQLLTLEEKNKTINELREQIENKDRSYKEIENNINESKKAQQVAKEKALHLQKELATKQNECAKLKEDLENMREDFIEKFSTLRAKIRKYETLIGEDIDTFMGNNNVLLDRIELLENEKYELNERLKEVLADHDKYKAFYDKHQFAQIKKRKQETKYTEDKYEVPKPGPQIKVRNYNIRDDEFYKN